MGKKIEGLVRVPSVLSNHTQYMYKGVSISRYYSEGTVGRVGVRRGGARYKTSKWSKTGKKPEFKGKSCLNAKPQLSY